jgi:hypothetical protein
MANKFFLVDVETAGDFSNPLCYDIAWRVLDRKGRIYSERNYLVREIVTNSQLMMGAFYAKKIFSWYIPALDSHDVRIASMADIVQQMREDAADASVVSAYNLAFDIRAIRATLVHTQIAGTIFSGPVDKLCVWRMACDALRSKLYHDLARARGWISAQGNVRTTAQHAYAYITGKFDFIESHTALDDVRIESEILTRLLARKKKIPYNQVSGNCWQLAQKVAA